MLASAFTAPSRRVKCALQNVAQVDLNLIENAIGEHEAVRASRGPVPVDLPLRLAMAVGRVKNQMTRDALCLGGSDLAIILKLSEALSQLHYATHLNPLCCSPERLESSHKGITNIRAGCHRLQVETAFLAETSLILRTDVKATACRPRLDALVVPAAQDALTRGAPEVDRLDATTANLADDLRLAPRQRERRHPRQCSKPFRWVVKREVDGRVKPTNTGKARPPHHWPNKTRSADWTKAKRRRQHTAITQPLCDEVEGRREIISASQTIWPWVTLSKKQSRTREETHPMPRY